ncbi:hypothetical protein PDJAM_G00029080 [Pangasius djambal]|uniref:Uncharacterized protein n=1 Tax=Pangasius djambal TaxID=1691987 RepID=A0ACC5YR15_9TELE|nr:hypothetical protein [Pangasius djambal]
MEEFLIPEDARSEHSFFSPIGSGKNRLDSVKNLLLYIRDYVKRNGLLTLSVLGVFTGCILGYTLRGCELSTQVWQEIQIINLPDLLLPLLLDIHNELSN